MRISRLDDPAAILRRRTRTAIGWVFVSQALLTSAAFLRSVILARFVGADAFGVIALAVLAVGALDVMAAGGGIQTALVQQQEPVEDDLATAFTIQAVRGATLMALLWLIAPLVAAFFDTPLVAPVIRGLSPLPLLQGLSNPAIALSVRELRFDRLFWWRLPEVLFGLALGLVAIMVRRDVWALVVTIVGGQAAATLCSYGVVRWRPRFACVRQVAWRLIRYGRWVQATRIVTYLCVYGDNAVVGRLCGTAALGFYQLAFRLAEVPTTAVALVAARVALPAMSELRQDPDRLRAWYFSGMRSLLAANVVFAALLLVFAGPVVRFLPGPGWEPAIPVLRILAMAMVFRSLIVFGAELFNALGTPQVTLAIHVVRLVTMAVTILPLTLRLGIEGAAISVLLAGVAGSVAQFRFAHTALVGPARKGHSRSED